MYWHASFDASIKSSVKYWIGCSGFSYKHWRDVFYPKGLSSTKWFEYYCQHFNTVELNVTFYRFPQLSFLKSWYDRSPEEFKFAVKAPRTITHFQKFTGSSELLNTFYETVKEGMKEKLGCILFQLPPGLAYNEEKLEQIINSLDTVFPNVIEFRHISWWNDKVYEILSRKNITFCGISHPKLPKDIIINNHLVYYRLHGATQLYKSPYSVEDLEEIIRVIAKNPEPKEVFCYFNNDIDVNAPRDAVKLRRLISSYLPSVRK